MRTSALSISAGLHVVFLILMWTGIPFLVAREFVIPPPIVVEFAEVAPVTETNKVAPTPQKPDEKVEPLPEESKPDNKPKPAPKSDAAKPSPPQKSDKADKKADFGKVLDKTLSDKADPMKEKADKKKKAEEASADFSSILKNLVDVKETPDGKGDMKLDEVAKQSGMQAPLGQKLTISEEDALRQQLERCWNVPIGARDVENMVVEVHLAVNPDMTVRDARIVDLGRYNSDSFFRAAADSAIRAVRNPLCSPLALPPDKYEQWQSIVVSFNPKEMF